LRREAEGIRGEQKSRRGELNGGEQKNRAEDCCEHSVKIEGYSKAIAAQLWGESKAIVNGCKANAKRLKSDRKALGNRLKSD
jgi:hypothetical protein